MLAFLTSKIAGPIFGGVAIVLLIVCAVLYWRAADVSSRLESVQTALNDCNASVSNLRGSLSRQEAEIARWKRAADDAAARSAKMMADALRATEATRATARAILARKPPPGVEICTAAWALAQERTR